MALALAENDLQAVLLRLAKEQPDLLKKVEEVANSGIKKSKLDLYELLIKNNAAFTYEALNNILDAWPNRRLDINWFKDDYIYRIVATRKKKTAEKPDRRKRENANGRTQK